jgi:hypothetical protein
MGTSSIVVGHPLGHDVRRCRSLSEMSRSRHSRRAVLINRSQNAFACGTRGGVFSALIDRKTLSTAGENTLQVSTCNSLSLEVVRKGGLARSP